MVGKGVLLCYMLSLRKWSVESYVHGKASLPENVCFSPSVSCSLAAQTRPSSYGRLSKEAREQLGSTQWQIPACFAIHSLSPRSVCRSSSRPSHVSRRSIAEHFPTHMRTMSTQYQWIVTCKPFFRQTTFGSTCGTSTTIPKASVSYFAYAMWLLTSFSPLVSLSEGGGGGGLTHLHRSIV